MAPKSIGRFELIAEVGNHPLGMLYKANDPKRGHITLLAIEAAKLTPETRKQVQQLFSRARTAALLNSPNIASVYGGGEADGYVFLSMEFIDGVTLRTAMARDGRLPSGEVLDIARQFCTALDHAQSKGVVHQNLHPGNIKIEWDGAVKLMDYGLDLPDKRRQDDSALHYAMRYASPEQLRGEPLTLKSNVYTLGAVLYELVTGSKAIAAEDPEGIRKQALAGSFEAPSRVYCEVREQISNAILKALSTNPAERFDSASALVRELEYTRPVLVKPQPIVPTAPTYSATRGKTNYGGPNTSAIFRAMQDNFSHRRAAVAEPAETAFSKAELPPLQPKAGDREFANTAIETSIPTQIAAPLRIEIPSGVEAVLPQVSETVYQEPAGSAKSPAKPSLAQSVFDVVDRVQSTVVAKTQATVAKAQLAARTAAVAKPIPVATPNRKTPSSNKPASRIVLPKTRKLLLVGLGMILAVGVLFAVSQFHLESSASTAAPVAPQQAAPVPQAEAQTLPPETVPMDEVRTRTFVRRVPKKAEVALVAVPVVGDVVVTSTPDGAEIQIDGRTDAQWLTPRTLSGISIGEHIVRISKPGYTTVIKTVALNGGEHAVVSVALQQIGAILNVTSEPAGAAILVDGKGTGKVTPAQVSVSTGPHRVLLRKDGFFEFSGSAVAQNGQTVAVDGTLTQAGRTDQIQTVGKFSKMFRGGNVGNNEMGKLRVKTQPKGAYIMVNGRPAPDASPSEFLLNPGTYEITLQLLGYRDVKRMIRVEQGKRVELDEVFQQR